MNLRYGYTVDAGVVAFFGEQTRKQREQLAAAFESLAENPFQDGENQRIQANERTLQVTAFRGRWVVSWWVDHPVRLVRIVEVHRLTSLA